MGTIRLLINNEDLDAEAKGTHVCRDPVTGEITSVAAAARSADAIKAAEAASQAFATWSRTSPATRRGLLNRAADLVEARRDAFAAAMMAETGATKGWSAFNVHLGAEILREAAALTTQVCGQTIPSGRPGCLAMSLRRPVGVVLGIAPWNAPVILGLRAVATPLACGNTVVLKASERCPATHRLIAEVLRDAGMAPGVINVISNHPQDAAEVVNTLIAHRAIRRISFTGSSKVGRLVAQKAAEALKPVVLELGGKSPLLVLDDADLQEAVNATVFGAVLNQGQICMSTERVIVQESVAAAFVERLQARAGALSIGDPRRDDVALGPMAGGDLARHVEDLVRDATSKGAKLIRTANPDGLMVPPMILDGVTAQMAIYWEESFGPVVCVLRAKDDAAAIALANDSAYGLSAAIFSQNISRALSMAENIESGICHINGPTVHDEAQMPFGGMKESGFGRFGGTAGIHEFTELRWVTINTQKIAYPF